ncbi:hypothetical protein [Alcanivorax sp.]|uniref:hypothetical protein n=1 Tax=Alcanivorax sp. TaxID=1872427 RepID=UPI000C102AFD|nr:hypothetical protein [Alcanivorax sp.]PHR68283.1 MAG: hypothetical protein COA55_01465 [Alcanivorax sp.]
MASFNELAKEYAQRIKQAIKRDGFSHGRKITGSNVQGSETLREAKAIKRDIDNLVYTSSNQPLTPQDRKRIIEQIDRELGLPKRIIEEGFVTNASNDDFSDLADEIENILKGGS